MQDSQYCYPNSDVLINKLKIVHKGKLLSAEKEVTFLRLKELQKKPLNGKFNFDHLKRIHKYIFHDLYAWAGQIRTVEIGKGNLFCTTRCIESYAAAVFQKYFPQCYSVKGNIEDFIRVLADNYGDLNALHPFRDGNGRAQREFARTLCLKCGYDFDLSCTTHAEMLEASKLSFNTGDCSGFISIFSKALHISGTQMPQSENNLKILTLDDLKISQTAEYDYHDLQEASDYNQAYEAKILSMRNKNKP